MGKKFSDWNKSLALKVERWYLNGLNMESAFKQEVSRRLKQGSLVLDAGAGKRSICMKEGLKVVGADISVADIAENPDLCLAVATNLSSSMPFRRETFDAITACYFAEHLPDTDRFIRNAELVLKPGGWMFLLFPCRYAPFAVVNRMIPTRWTLGLLRGFLQDEHGGFPANYSLCWPRAMRELLESRGMNIVRQEVCYYQAFYCASFFPLYLVSLCYDLATRASGIEALASSILIVAQKPNRKMRNRAQNLNAPSLISTPESALLHYPN